MEYGNSNGGSGYGGAAVGRAGVDQFHATGLASQPVPRMPMVSAEVERLRKGTEAIHQIIGELEGRLSSVTRADSANAPGTGKDQPALPMVGLAAVLAGNNEAIEHAYLRLSSLLHRIEL